MTVKLVKCIACNGHGKVKRIVRKTITDKQRKEIFRMYRKGLGFREIARQLKIDHPYTVQYTIKTANKTIK